MLQPGQLIQDKYRIVRLIGQGGMGEVYEGENVSIARRVAIKVLLGEAAMNADIVQRFEREAQAAGRIGNDHILEVLDLGALPTGDRFMVMEFLDGEPLNSRIERLRQLTAEQACPIVLQALAGLAAAHHAGIIHRDLKPENLFVLKQKAGVADYVKIIDFGISKFSQLSNEGMKMTKTGSVMGTPYYMSPEQANGSREADARSDLYAMGVILYECVTGAVPFDGKTFNELLFKIVLSDAPPPRTLAPESGSRVRGHHHEGHGARGHASLSNLRGVFTGAARLSSRPRHADGRCHGSGARVQSGSASRCTSVAATAGRRARRSVDWCQLVEHRGAPPEAQ